MAGQGKGHKEKSRGNCLVQTFAGISYYCYHYCTMDVSIAIEFFSFFSTKQSKQWSG